MQRLTKCTVILSLIALVGTWSAPTLAAQTSTVRCESKGQAIVQCPIAPNSRVELTRTLSQEACRQGHNWDVAANFVWVSGGCGADFTVTAAGYGQGQGHGQGNAEANPNQLRACRSEADRRMAAYSYDQISVESDSRQGNVAYVRWRAGTTNGLCTVAANGRILQFTTNAAGVGDVTPAVTTQVVCESQRTERKECPVPAGARVRFLRQLSQNPCRLNDTYGQAPQYIWVAKGCRGEFEVVTGGGGGATTGVLRTICASAPNTRRQCPIPAGAQVTLIKQLSVVACISGQNWGVGPDYVWVARGCGAQFAVTGGSGGQDGNAATTKRIVCESHRVAREQCEIAGGTAVRVVKQYSTNPCTLNQTFGIASGYMWVSNGCRGEFEVTIAGSQPLPGGGETGTGLPDRVLCESKGGERMECRVKVGGKVTLARQLSTTACTQGSTWGYGYGMIWVTKGCRGEFEVK